MLAQGSPPICRRTLTGVSLTVSNWHLFAFRRFFILFGDGGTYFMVVENILVIVSHIWLDWIFSRILFSFLTLCNILWLIDGVCGPGDGHFDEHGHHYLHSNNHPKRTASEPRSSAATTAAAAATTPRAPSPSTLSLTDHPVNSPNLSPIQESISKTPVDTNIVDLVDPPSVEWLKCLCI